MADIFISWGSPDREAVLPLRDRLRDVGLDVWEYSEDMGAGNAIQEKVMRTLADVRIAIFCLSDESAGRKWMVDEIAASVFARANNQIEHLVPVQVGPLSKDTVPDAFQRADLYIPDLSGPEGMRENLEDFVEDICDLLGQRVPVIMPAVIFAMTKDESMELFDEWKQTYVQLMAEQEGANGEGAAGAARGREAQDPTRHPAGGRPGANQPGSRISPEEEFWKLCKHVGMDNPPELFKFLLQRYGETPEDLTPFEQGQRIVDVINSILREVNEVRLGQNHRPIFLRWLSRDAFDGNDEETEEVRDQWSSRNSLLIVDSVSTFYRPIKDKLVTVPAQRTALLWLPPYTWHTDSLKEALRSSARFIPSIGDEFRNWSRHPNRSISFDTSTSLGLQVWLRRALFQVSDEAGALRENVEVISSTNRPAGNPGAGIFGRGGSK